MGGGIVSNTRFIVDRCSHWLEWSVEGLSGNRANSKTCSHQFHQVVAVALGVAAVESSSQTHGHQDSPEDSVTRLQDEST